MIKIYLQSVNSTQLYLKNLLKTQPDEFLVWTTNQTNGIGSRNNSWLGKQGNLFFSLSFHKNKLPKDLKLESRSIYFSYILKDILKTLGSQIFLKWPNDFYIKNKKIGGTITNLVSDYLVCGIGLNLVDVDKEFGYLDITIDVENVLDNYIAILNNPPLWSDIFIKYKQDFEQSQTLNTTINNAKISLKNAILNIDGSISINNQKYFSYR